MEQFVLDKATAVDKPEILLLFQRAVEHLNASGIAQWDAVYPHASNVEEDIQKGQLYLMRADGRIAGVITLNQSFDPEYQKAKWTYQGNDFAVIHRLCVSPDVQGRGVGTRIMRMAEAMLAENGIQSVRLDCFSQNSHSQRLYEKLGYRTVGEAVWRKGLFYLMEKNIGESSHGA